MPRDAVLARYRQRWPAHSVPVGRLACRLLLASRSDVCRACLAPQGHRPVDTACMSCGCDVMPSQENTEE